MNQSSSQKQTTTQTDRSLWVELSDEELSNVSGGTDPQQSGPPDNDAGCKSSSEVGIIDIIANKIL